MNETDRVPPSDPLPDDAEQPEERGAVMARRALLGAMGIVTITGLASAGLALGGYRSPDSDRTPPPIGPRRAAPVTEATTTPATPAPSHADHEASAEAKVKAFPAKTAGTGLQPLPSIIVNGVREFDLSCAEIDWEVTPGVKVKALAYNGQVPGPIIRATEGERVRIKVTNRLTEATGVHWHGLRIPNAMDGVPYLTQAPILPGGSFTYEFTVKNAGSHMYHSHHNATDQVGRGLLGPFLVTPKDPASDPKFDKDEIFILNESLGGFTVNGKGFPATTPYTAKLGERVRFRFMNEGNMAHPVHLHGFAMQVFARDGYPLPQPFFCDTLDIAPGERWDAIVVADEPGVWAFHCHILTHAEGLQGMFGMVTAFIVS